MISGSRPSSRRGSQSSYIRQVVEKVEALKIDFEESGTPPVTSGNTEPLPTSVAATPECTRPDTIIFGTDNETSHSSTSLATQSSTGTVQESTPSTTDTNELSIGDTTSHSKVFDKESFAENMCDPDFVRDYFSNIVEHPASFAVDENIEERELSLRTPIEISMAQDRGEHRLSQVCNFPLRLILTPISRVGIIAKTFSSLLDMEFGPLHVALQVGDVILEWNDSSLVIPHFSEHDDPLLKADIQHLCGWVDFTNEHVPSMKEAAEKLDYPGQIDLIFRATAEKSRLINNLVKVIVNYNRYHHYNLINRNCQHFVSDALKALGVEKPVQFTGGLGDYFKALKSGCSKSVKIEYTTHAELDAYMRNLQAKGDLNAMPQGDLEFLLAMYFKFHLDNRRQYMKDPIALENWKCTERLCLMKELESRIQLKNLRFLNFRTVH